MQLGLKLTDTFNSGPGFAMAVQVGFANPRSTYGMLFCGNRYEIGWTKNLDQKWREVEAARAPLYEGTGDFWWAWALQARCLDLGCGLSLSWTRPKLGLVCSYEEGTSYIWCLQM